MLLRILLLTSVLSSLTACMATPRINIRETLKFDQPAPSQEPVSYADLMCCYDCTV